nr:DUF262 domain-containing protein [Roseococcus sp. SDR]
MSVSELLSMYRDGELDLHPEFQRFFRWTDEQKSRLIESLILGIPIPPIFVSEREDSKWDVIDGLQRLSTILELMGELVDEEGRRKPPLMLLQTHYLPDLESRYWVHEEENSSLPESVRIKIKRARLDINIVKSTSDTDVKYEVFQRLNKGGASATEQEIRNCLLVMSNRGYFNWIQHLSKSEAFKQTLSLTERAVEEAFDIELVCRLLIFSRKEVEELQRLDELGAYLNREAVSQARDKNFPFELMEFTFNQTFSYLAEHLQENAFRRYSTQSGRYVGPLLVSIYEVVAVGLANRLQGGASLPPSREFLDRHQKLWSELGQKKFVGSGVRASTRVPETVRFGREWVQV